MNVRLRFAAVAVACAVVALAPSCGNLRHKISKCVRCNGRGHEQCGACKGQGNRGTCATCQGAGAQCCPACNTPNRTQPCAHCKSQNPRCTCCCGATATPHAKCAPCGGAGVLGCGSCGASGRVKCISCNGTGKTGRGGDHDD